jgi:predicted Holliday junction resolvase-like endonuclease
MDLYFLLCGSVLFSVFLFILNHKQKSKIAELQEQKSKLFSQKRSTEVRTGHIVEKFAPFLDTFPHDPESAVFLGQPIDYIVFEEDGVTFSEVKSGNSQLSKKQRKIKENIQNGNVFWEEIRVK